MIRGFRQVVTRVIGAVAVFLSLSPAQAVDTAPDPVRKGWNSRAETAAKKLSLPGLDKCDKGVELAFRQFREVTSGKKRNVELTIEIDKQEMVASYSYEGERLDSFVLLELPSGWLAVQKTGSKTLNMLVPESNCSFDLCTSDPFTAGPCAEQGKR